MDYDQRQQSDTSIPNVFIQSPITQMHDAPFPNESFNLIHMDSFPFIDESQLYECVQSEKRQYVDNSQSSKCEFKKKRRIGISECNTYTSNKRSLHTNEDKQLPFRVKKQCSIQKFNNSIQLFPWKALPEIYFNEKKYKEWSQLRERFHRLVAEFSREWTVNYDELELDEIDSWSDQFMSLNEAYNTAENLLEIAWANTDEAWKNTVGNLWNQLYIIEQELDVFLES